MVAVAAAACGKLAGAKHIFMATVPPSAIFNCPQLGYDNVMMGTT